MGHTVEKETLVENDEDTKGQKIGAGSDDWHGVASWKFLLCAVTLFCAALAASCERAPTSGPNPNDKHYQLTGRVVSVDKANKSLVVDGDEIPGYMMAMAMPYSVKDPKLLEQVNPGDQIKADLVVASDSDYLASITVTKKGSGNPPPPSTEFHMPQPGEGVPDFALVNQDGARIHLKQYRGKSILLTFFYTRCPLPDFCPLMNTNFSVIEEGLEKNKRSFGTTQLLSISFDAQHDTPAVLRKYGSGYTQSAGESNFKHWEFTAVPPNELDDVTKFFGLTYQQDQGQVVHSLSTAIISPDGKIYKWYHGNDWRSADVLKDLLDSLGS